MNKKHIPYKGVLTAIIGIIFMIIGVFQGQASTVLAKAIRVCLECIGIG